MREFATGPGFFKVEQDRAIALVDDAVLAHEIDVERARQQLEEAQAELEKIERGESEADRWQIEQRIRHAENQLTTAGPDNGYRRASRRPFRLADKVSSVGLIRRGALPDCCRVRAVARRLRS